MIVAIGVAKAKVKVKLGIPEKKEMPHESEMMEGMSQEMGCAYEEAMRSREQLWEGVGREQGVFGGYDSVASGNGDEITTEFTGTAYNVACHLAKDGNPAKAEEPVTFISLAGKDIMGEALIGELDEIGVDTSCIKRVAGKTPIEVEVVNFLNDLQFSRYNGGIEGEFAPEIIKEYGDIIAKASAVVVDGTLPEETISYISSEYGDKVKIIFDPGSFPGAEKVKLRKSDALAGMYCVVPGRMEAEAICGRSILGRDELAAAAGLLEDKGVAMAVITMKGGGLYYRSKDGEDIMRPQRVLKFAEPEGAGDLLTAAVARGFARNLSSEIVCQEAMDAVGKYLEDVEDKF